MRIPLPFLFLAAALLLAAIPPAGATVYQTADETYELSAKPIDIAGSETGTTFVLTEGGKVLIFKKNGEHGEITVDRDFDRIDANAGGDKIFLSSSRTRKAQTVYVDFQQQINIDGSPYLGPEDAPVVMVVFSDFQ